MLLSKQRSILFFVAITLLLFYINLGQSPLETVLTKAKNSTEVKNTLRYVSRPTRSSQSTVMGFATGYDIGVYKLFVGSLKKSGFQGNIILAVDSTMKPTVENYLLGNNVTIKKVEYGNCSTSFLNSREPTDTHERELTSCVKPYTDLKARWGRFPLLRDYLRECKECIGDVLVTDVRDTYFQCDPFSYTAPPIRGLQVFEEERRMRTTNWLVKWPVEECKGVTYDEPMLCSGKREWQRGS